MHFSKNGVARVLYLISATVKETMEHLDFVSAEETQVTGKCCSIGTSE